MERLLGPDGGIQGTRQHQSTLAAGGGQDGAFWDSRRGDSASANRLLKRRLKGDGQANSEQPTNSWTRRIRGLLFVIMGELVKSLDATLATSNNAASSHQVCLIMFFASSKLIE